MGIINRKTSERKLVGQIIHECGTFRLDTSMDEIIYWCIEDQKPKTIHLCGEDWFLETKGPDLSEENRVAFEKYLKQREIEHNEKMVKYESQQISVGRTVKVVRGRKVPKGFVGQVTKIFRNIDYTSVQIIDQDGVSYWTYSPNLEVIGDNNG